MGTTWADSASGSRQTTLCRLGAVAGMLGASLFVTLFLVQGWLRPGYSPISMFVSELSIGAQGWVQVANFVVTGSLMVVFARGLAIALQGGVAAVAGPVLLTMIGIALIASGPFVADPSTSFDQHSVHGIIHGLFGAVVFSLSPAVCLVLYRRFRRDPAWHGLATWTLVIGVTMILEVVLLKIAEQPAWALFSWKGLIQRVILISFMAWVFTVAARLRIIAAGGRTSVQR